MPIASLVLHSFHFPLPNLFLFSIPFEMSESSFVRLFMLPNSRGNYMINIWHEKNVRQRGVRFLITKQELLAQNWITWFFGRWREQAAHQIWNRSSLILYSWAERTGPTNVNAYGELFIVSFRATMGLCARPCVEISAIYGPMHACELECSLQSRKIESNAIDRWATRFRLAIPRAASKGE